MGRRVAAYIIDGIVLLLASGAANLMVGRVASVHDARADALIAVVVASAVSVAYFFFSWTLLSASLGQLAFGLRTVSHPEGAYPTESDALRRWGYLYGPTTLLLPAVSATSGGVGPALWGLAGLLYLISLYRTTVGDPLRRGLHDQRSATMVVRNLGGRRRFPRSMIASDGSAASPHSR